MSIDPTLADGTAPGHKLFNFGTDFGRVARGQRAPTPAELDLSRAVQQAREEALARGHAEGLAQGRDEADNRLSAALECVAAQVETVLRQADAAQAEAQDVAVSFARLFALRIAGAALDAAPLADLDAAARDIFRELRQTPHVVVRLDEALIEHAEPMLQRAARERGFEGRLILLGEPDMLPGDFKLEWADGGLMRDRAATLAAIDRIVARCLPAASAARILED